MANLSPTPPPALTRWQPGKSGNPSGRPRRLLRRVDEILHESGKSPVEEILALIPQMPPTGQLKTWLELLPYVYPRIKDEALSQEDIEMEKLRALSTAELMKIVKAKLPQLEKETALQRG